MSVGATPTGTVAVTVLVAVLMTETVLSADFENIDQRLVAPHGCGQAPQANRNGSWRHGVGGGVDDGSVTAVKVGDVDERPLLGLHGLRKEHHQRAEPSAPEQRRAACAIAIQVTAMVAQLWALMVVC